MMNFGFSELVVLAIVILLFIDPKRVGEIIRAFGTLRRKWNGLQNDVKQQFDALSLEDNLRESVNSVRTAKAALRREARDAVRALTAADRAAAAEKILQRLRDWPTWREASVITGFCGTHDELDTEGILREALGEGKIVLLPRVEETADGKSRMTMVRIHDYDRDLEEGAFGILAPRDDLPEEEGGPDPDLILVPGTAFDERGGRVGRGRGFYDRWLEGRAGTRAGLAFEAQVLRKKLALEPHDQLLDGLVTERRLLAFARPQTRPKGPETRRTDEKTG